jgi:transcriptional regulator of acetoin/glycerol metabolism
LEHLGERDQLVQALRKCAGNKAEAARLLNMPRSTFFSKLRKHGLTNPSDLAGP